MRSTGPGTAERVVIIGAGGHGRELLTILDAVTHQRSGYECMGFVDDGDIDATLLGARRAPLLGGTDVLAELAGCRYLLGIGSPATRRRIDSLALASGLEPVTIAHPAATVGKPMTMGPGCVLFSHVSVTTDVRLGRQVHLNQNATVGHDCSFGDFVTVNPGANVSGAVTLGDEVLVGAGAVILQGVTVGAGTVVGAGAVVTRDLPSGAVAVGVPARLR